jgi:hypothetical protein
MHAIAPLARSRISAPRYGRETIRFDPDGVIDSSVIKASFARGWVQAYRP